MFPLTASSRTGISGLTFVWHPLVDDPSIRPRELREPFERVTCAVEALRCHFPGSLVSLPILGEIENTLTVEFDE